MATKPVAEGYRGQDKRAFADDPWPYLYEKLRSGEIIQEMVTGIERLEDNKVQLVIAFGPVKGVVLPDEVGENLNSKTSLIGQHIALRVKACDRPNGVAYLSRKDAIAKMAEETWAYLQDVCKGVIEIHNGEVAPMKAKLASLEDQKGPEAEEAKERIREAYRRTAEVSPPLTGVVRWVTAKGAHMDIGGLIAFLPVVESTWGIQRNCRAVLSAGDAVDVKVLDIDPETRQVLVSRRAMTPDPWITAERKYREGGVYFGTVKMVAADYLVVEIEPGIAGLAFRPPMEEIPEGAEVVVKLLKFDIPKRRVRLNLTRVLERGA